MKLIKILFIWLSLSLILTVVYISAGKTPEAPANWFNLDKNDDGVFGISIEKAYRELLKDKKGVTVIVAVIDSGVDIIHEDLKGKIWINENEIPANGIDDDRNGYIDDIHGWNFNGGKDGSSVRVDNWELTRMVVRYKEKFKNVNIQKLNREEKKLYEKYLVIKKEYEELLKKSKTNLKTLEETYKKYIDAEKKITAYLKTKEFSDKQVEFINSENAEIKAAKKNFLFYNKHNWKHKKFQDSIRFSKRMIDLKLNPHADHRYIVNDNYKNKSERYYGNNNVKGSEAWHGTVNAGIIGANRNNNIGIKGIADNVRLMVLRVAPDYGDERDKDVANAIYYAVENGARILNISLSKTHSPDKKWVDKAVRYAEKHNVLLVTGSGNDGKNIDEKPLFPNPVYLNSGQKCLSWIITGASSWKEDRNLAAPFSNHGKNMVDLFAPGIDIFTTFHENNYGKVEGTSQSAPMVSGVAALVWSYFPDLTAVQLKEILLQSTAKYKKITVRCPGNPNKTVEFGELSRTGGIVNAYQAILRAKTYLKK